MSSVTDGGRVIAGSARSIRLRAPGEGTRPLGDRVKQTLFAMLEPSLPGSRFLDLFAGSGAAGIEALSRGAAEAVFIERDAVACAVIATNLERTGMTGSDRATRVIRADALGWIRDRARAAEPAWDLVFLDPPYAETELLSATLASLGPLVAPGGRVVAKHFWRDAPPARAGLLASDRDRRFGETALTFYRRADTADVADTGDTAQPTAALPEDG